MFDVQINTKTGDWLFSGNRDLQMVEGNAAVQQRIITRLKIEQGWLLDPSGGQLGSRLSEKLQSISTIAITEMDQLVREALAPMNDIVVDEVSPEPDESGREINLHITYRIIGVEAEQTNFPTAEEIVFELTQGV